MIKKRFGAVCATLLCALAPQKIRYNPPPTVFWAMWLGILALLVIFYLVRGMVRIEAGRSGRTIVRFNMFERFVHWMSATCFVVLAVTGLIVGGTLNIVAEALLLAQAALLVAPGTMAERWPWPVTTSRRWTSIR